VDLLDENGFYRKGEDEISAVNQRITQLELLPEYQQALSNWKDANQQAETEIANFRIAMKAAKKQRDEKRAEAENQLSAESFAALKDILKNESLKWQYDFKILQQTWDNKRQQYQQALSIYTSEIEELKQWRKEHSAALQQRLFDHYRFINRQGETKDVCDIFSQTELKVPPAGAGDCAAPKLLQYAYLNNLEPLSMAEFWWGQTPKSEIRQHGHFYPSCRSKCEPILGHMLKGLDVDPNPLLTLATQAPEILFEDEWIGVLDKPAEFLSVPGKTSAPSAYTFLKEKYPTATGPLIVHRLDMSTSGLMVFAKDLANYHHLQNQFLHHTVKKRYVALLKGYVTTDQGTIDLPLRADFDDRPRQLVCFDYGKHALTQYEVVERAKGCTRVYFYPQTGRTHQLRVHAAHKQGLNCPIVGDDLYGIKADRLHLHAETLEFIHPHTAQEMKFYAKAGF
jgi:tRNA pseudouridine32 synthase/23S rRNA pseudouridine746 synthase